MKHAGWLALLAVLFVPVPRPPSPFCRGHSLERLNRHLHGRVVDHTHNHGVDRRIWSPALCQRRDMYVYLPPGYDPCQRYPILVYLHGFSQDEMSFLEGAVRPLDKAIACGELPPVIVAAPDGSQRGLPCLLSSGTFFLNSNTGRFEDYLVEDVWSFLVTHYPIRPEREAHVLFGVSMGGSAAYNKAIKYRERFGVAVGLFPPLNARWMDCHGNYMANFDPNCWGWRTDFSNGREVVGRFFGVITIRLRRMVYPLYGRNSPEVLANVIRENPIEMLDQYEVKPGQIRMYVGYGQFDEFNLDAQVESFLYRARQLGLEVGVGYDPKGHHGESTAMRLLPGVLTWLRPLLAPYSPPGLKDDKVTR